MLRISATLCLAILLLCATVLSQKNKSMKARFVPWSVLERDGKKLCPLCGEEYQPKNFTELPSKLSLSEWHPNNLDSVYFETKIADISDGELVNSIAWDGMMDRKELKASIGDYKTALSKLATKKKNEEDNNRYYGYNQFEEGAYTTVEEYKQLMKADSAKYTAVMKEAANILDYNIPHSTRHFKFENAIDFNYNFGESGKYGFHYWGWGYYLTSAYMLTGDERYVEAFDAMFNQWYEQRNSISNTLPQFDVVWYELGIAARVPMFIDAFRLFKNSPRLRGETRDRMLRTLLGSGRWLAEALRRNPYHAYNWPIHTAISEAYLAITFPEFKESSGWLAAAKKVMEDHLARDVYDDGGYLERAPGYSYGVFSHFYRYLSLFQYFLKDKAYVEKHRQRLEKMVEFVVLTMSPLGTSCPFNDSYRSSVVDFVYKHGNEMKRSDFLGAILPELSKDKVRNASVKPKAPKVSSINLAESKFAVMRSDWSRDAAMMIINYGPPANHHHYDVLDFEIYANGRAIAVDAGIGLKGYDDELHRPWYRATQSHNMVMVNDTSIERGEAEGDDVVWATQKLTDYFAASHSGYKSAFGVVNRRHIAFVKPRYWIIYDKITSAKSGLKLDWLFHSPLTLEKLSSGYVSKETPGALVLSADTDHGRTQSTKSEGMASLAGLSDEKEPFRKIHYVSFQKRTSIGEGENEFGVLVFPFSENRPEVGFHQLKTSPEVAGYTVKLGPTEDRLYFSDGQKQNFAEGIESDAQFLYLQYENGRLQKVNAVAAGYCSVNGKILMNEKRLKNFERMY
jgi:hypothetical protein